MHRIYLLLLVIITIAYVECIRFKLQPHTKRCVKEEMRKDVLAVGEYEVSAADGTTVDFQITDSRGHTALMRDNIDKGKFAVTSDEDDLYDYCFAYSSASSHVQPNLIPREVYLDTKVGVEAKHIDDKASTDKLQQLEAELTKLEDLTNSIIADFAYMKKREAEMRDTNDSTSARVSWQCFTSIIVFIVVATWQILYLRQFFKSRKLID
ncbi:Transmembrane emp24 domain-containing protein 10, partial [Fragariocoptes setiger]